MIPFSLRHLSALALAGLTATAFAVTESEPNDAHFAANAMGGFPATLNGTLANDPTSSGFYDDFWSFTAVSGATYQINASGGNVVFPMDIGLVVQDAIGNDLVTDDQLGDNAGETLTWIAPSSGTFYLIVYEAFGAPSTATYTVNVSESLPSDVSDWYLY